MICVIGSVNIQLKLWCSFQDGSTSESGENSVLQLNMRKGKLHLSDVRLTDFTGKEQGKNRAPFL